MRAEPTLAENHLWRFIRRQALGVKFRRQHVFDRFIVDFYSHEARLVIEVDGIIHEYTQEQDAVRQAFLESLGLRVVRFTNGEVLQQTPAVLEQIGEVLLEIRDQSTPSQPPPFTAEGMTVFKDEVGKGQEKGRYKYEMGQDRSNAS